MLRVIQLDGKWFRKYAIQNTITGAALQSRHWTVRGAKRKADHMTQKFNKVVAGICK